MAVESYSIETTVTLGMVLGLASRQTEGFVRSLFTLLNLNNDVPDHTTISRRRAKLGKLKRTVGSPLPVSAVTESSAGPKPENIGKVSAVLYLKELVR